MRMPRDLSEDVLCFRVEGSKMSVNPKVHLGDETLFGNEAAEDERDEIFESYAYPRPEVQRFCDPNRAIQIARAYKGEGKSALIRLARLQVSHDPTALPLQTTGPSLSPETEGTDFDKWVRTWKSSIFKFTANEVGSRIGSAWTDDAISLVELAEQNGFKKRNFVSSIIDRIAGIGPKRERQLPPEPGAVLARWSGTPPEIWLFIDDLDRSFEHTERSTVKLAAFFDACRQITNSVPSIRFRLAIRPNTWTTIKLRSEALSHVEQYTSALRWSEHEMLALLGRRVEGYLQRTDQLDALSQYLPNKGPERDKTLLSYVFESPIQWGDKLRPIHVPLYTLSQHRPRWVIELCRLAARRAERQGHPRILRDDIIAELMQFGKRRIEDMIAEFRPQCPGIGELIDAFRGQAEQYHTDELLTLIENRITNHLNAKIVGVSTKPSHRQIGSFLFEIGFLFARRDFEDGSYDHLSFTEQPSLLVSRSDMDSGVTWEIPPIFRQALDLRTVDGFERPVFRPTSKKNRRIVSSEPPK
jgi:hypothetical protein